MGRAWTLVSRSPCPVRMSASGGHRGQTPMLCRNTLQTGKKEYGGRRQHEWGPESVPSASPGEEVPLTSHHTTASCLMGTLRTGDLVSNKTPQP